MHTTSADEPDLILVIDDTPKNLQVLGTILHEKGYDVAAATSAGQALSILEHTSPGLILLDVMMPEMDGYQMLNKLKENVVTAEIPVIFITARVEPDEVVKGFNAGAVDYITKPFNATELLSRVKVHLTLKKNRDQMSNLNRKLRNQARELQHLNQEKNDMLGIVAHDLKNPLANILGIAEQMASPEYEATTEILTRDAGRVVRTAESMFRLINNLLNINAIEAGGVELKWQYVDICHLVERIISLYQTHAERKMLAVHCFFENDGNPTFYTDPNALYQILDNVISNAIKYSPPGAQVTIHVSIKIDERHLLTIAVSDQGQGLTAEDMENLFGKFKRLSAKPTGDESSTGLGLAIAKKLTDRLNGRIEAESTPGAGATFIITLPEAIISE